MKPSKFDVGPVTSMTIYSSGDAVIGRKDVNKKAREIRDVERGKIRFLSGTSRNRMLFMLRNTSVTFQSMYCLSYPEEWPGDGVEVKDDLNKWLSKVRRYYQPSRDDIEPSMEYFWFMEFQKRGAPHIHVYFNLPKEFIWQGKIAMDWAIIVSPEDIEVRKNVYSVHSHKKQLVQFESREGPTRYATKYALKTEQKNVPPHYQNVGRFWGSSRGVKTSVEEGVTVEITDDQLDDVLRSLKHRTSEWDMKPRYIFGLVDTVEKEKHVVGMGLWDGRTD